MGSDNPVSQRLDDLERRVARLEEANDVDSDAHVQEQPQKEPAEEQVEKDSSSMSSGKAMAWIGGILLGLGFVFLVSYAINQGWISLQAQIFLGVIAGLLIIGGGRKLHASKSLQGSLVTGAGLATVYFSIFAGYVFPSYQGATGLSFTSTSVLLLLTVLGGLGLSLRQRSGVLVVEALVLGFLTQFTTSFQDWLNWASFTYTSLLTVASAYLTHRQNWYKSLGAVGGVSAVFTATTVTKASPALHSPIIWSFIAVFAATFLVASLVRDRPTTGLLTIAAAYGMSLIPVDSFAPITLGYAALSLAVYAYTASVETEKTQYLVTGVALLAVYIPLQFDTVVTKPVWALLFAIAGYTHTKRLENKWFAGLTHVLAIPTFAMFIIESGLSVASILGSVFVLIAYSFVSLAYASSERFEAHAYYIISALLAMVLAAQHASETVLTVTWGVIGLISLFIGSKTSRSVPRVAGLVVLGITVVKLLVIDTSSLDPVLRIVSYITLGLILLGGSIFYKSKADTAG